MYVAVNSGQYGRHLKILASYGIQKYLIVFLDSKNPNLDTEIITVAILEVKICVKMCLVSILAAILDFVKTQQNFNTNPRIQIQDINNYICTKLQFFYFSLYYFYTIFREYERIFYEPIIKSLKLLENIRKHS